jgi:hypothetical protein
MSQWKQRIVESLDLPNTFPFIMLILNSVFVEFIRWIKRHLFHPLKLLILLLTSYI